LTILCVCLACLLLLQLANAQDSSSEAIYFNLRHGKIPFNPLPARQRVKQLQLFLSADHGRTWQPSAVAPPDQGYFRFICDRDGLYWFTVQTLDMDGRYFPPALDNAQ